MMTSLSNILANQYAAPAGRAGAVSSNSPGQNDSQAWPTVRFGGDGQKDSVEISAGYRSAAADKSGDPASAGSEKTGNASGERNGESGKAKAADGQDLSEDEQKQLDELKSRDREVRAHEQAHKSAGGGYAGAASYEYQMGPDGQRYAVGGEVSIDASKEKDPEATIAKMKIIQAAALAPSEPSGQDRAVAAAAAQAEMQARQELARQDAEGSDEAAAGGQAASASPSGSEQNGTVGAEANVSEAFTSPGSNKAANPWTRSRSTASRLNVVA